MANEQDCDIGIFDELSGCMKKSYIEQQKTYLEERVIPNNQDFCDQYENSLWTDKYQPKNANEVCGNNESVKFLSEWLRSWYEKDSQTIENGDRQGIDYNWNQTDLESEDDEVLKKQNVLLVTVPVGFKLHEDTQLWKFIEKIATKRFSEWKHDCRAHWEQFGDEIPLEFLERPDQWEWLCNHFKDPKQQELSARMKWVRGQKKMNHHSGKLAFSYRAEEHLLKNNPAPFVASFSDAYSRDPVARPYVDQMIERVNMMVEERLAEHPEIPINAPFDTAKQVGVIESIVGERRGTEIRGMGDCMRRKPCPRGGPTHMPYVAILEEKIAAQEEKIAAQEEMLIAQDEEKNEIKSRLADLEEQFRQFFGGGQ